MMRCFIRTTMVVLFAALRIDGGIATKQIHYKQTLHGPIIGFGIPF